MGMLGAMAGLGQGMQNFSLMLNEKAKMDWQTQRDQALWERQKNLEEIKMKHAETMQGNQQEFLGGQQDKQMEFQAQNQQIADLNAESRLNTDMGFKREMSAEEHSNRLQEISQSKAAQVDAAIKIANLQENLSDKKKAKQLALIDSNEMFSDAEKKILKLAVEDKEVASTYLSLARQGGDDKVIESYSDNYMKALAEWNGGSMNEDVKSQWTVKLNQAGIKEPDKQAKAYADTIARDSVGGRSPSAGKGILAGASSPNEPPPELPRYTPKALETVVNQIVSGGITLADAKTKLLPDQYALVEGQVKRSSRDSSEPDNLFPGGAVQTYTKDEPSHNQKYFQRESLKKSGVMSSILSNN